MLASQHDKPSGEGSSAFYADLFRQQIATCVRYVLAQVQASGDSLSLDLRNHALHLLEHYALQLAEVKTDALTLLVALAPRVERTGLRNEWLAFLERGIASCKDETHLRFKAELEYHVGFIHQLQAQYAAAQRCLLASVASFRSINGTIGLVKALNRLAFVERLQGQPQIAQQLVAEAMTLLEPDHPSHEFSHFNLAVLAEDRGDYAKAVDHYQRSLQLCQQLNDPHQVALRLSNLGLGLYHNKQFEQALDCYQKAIDFFASNGDHFRVAGTHNNLGIVHLALENFAQAVAIFEQAEQTFRAVNDSHHLALTYLNLGIAHRHLHGFKKSEAYLSNAIDYWRKIGSVAQLVNTFDELGLTLTAGRAYTNAKDVYLEALTVLSSSAATPELNRLRQRVELHLQQVATSQQGQPNRR